MKNIFLLAALLFVSANLSHAQNLQGKIIFSYQCDTCTHDSIFALTNNGTNLEFVTNGYRPRLSHNGRYLAFSKGTAAHYTGYNENLWIRDLISQHDTQIVSNTNDYLDYYDFYPSDQKIIYSQGCAIYSTNIDGSAAYTNISSAGCYSDHPNVRLADSLVAFHETYNGLYTLHIDGTNQTLIPHTHPGDLFSAWSPDGVWIAFLKSVQGQPYITNNLFKIKPDGSDSTQLTFFAPGEDTLSSVPVWASDMQTIYIMGSIHDSLGLFKVSADGSGHYECVYKWRSKQYPFCFWLGLADSISSIPSGTEIFSEENNMTISPDPCNEFTVIHTSGNHDNLISLFDLNGRKIRSYRSDDDAFKIITADLTPGIYFIQMKNEEQILVKKLVVTHTE